MPKRTEHSHRRHAQGDRPTREAFQDRQNPMEVFLDQHSGYIVYIGPNGRTHLFTPEGSHHTSFVTSRRGRLRRVAQGRWRPV
jgi:hypothetical protein